MSSRTLGRMALAAIISAVTLLPSSAQAASPRPEPKPATKIEHLLVLMQENHTFDNYFGTFPGADGIPSDACMPRALTLATPSPSPSRSSAPTVKPKQTPVPTPAQPSLPPATGCIKPYHIATRGTADPDHGKASALAAYNSGAMNGFVYAQRARARDENAPMGYWDGRDLPLYWNLAKDYVLADRFFSSAWGGSQTNHLFWVAGQAAGSHGGIPKGGFTATTIFDRLQAAGVSWKMYIQNYDPRITYRCLQAKTCPKRPGGGGAAPQVVWAPLLAFPRFLDTPALYKNIVDLSQYYTDLKNGTLPAVSYIVPSSSSEHPPGNVTVGQNFGASLVTSVMRSSAWNSSLFVLTHDDWGGYYDHVVPRQLPDLDGYGFRVPAIFISPFVRRGTIDSTVYDYTSILRFIEDNWRVAPIAIRDKTANSIASRLDFRGPPAPPIFPAQNYAAVESAPSSTRLTLMSVYAAVVALMLIGLLALPFSRARLRRLRFRRRPG